MLRFRSGPTVRPLWSATASWLDFVDYQVIDATNTLPVGWAQQWTLTTAHDHEERTTAVADKPLGDLLAGEPTRHPTWHPNVRNRAGLFFMPSTSSLVPHESIFERDTLRALAYSEPTSVSFQPFRLNWADDGRSHEHFPDFLIELDGRVVVVNCRPEALVNDSLLCNCAAVSAVADLRGWAHVLVTGFKQPAYTNLSAFAAHVRDYDQLGLGANLVAFIKQNGPMSFADLAAASPAYPLMVRAVAQHLIWHRQLSVDLNSVITAETLLHLPDHDGEPQG